MSASLTEAWWPWIALICFGFLPSEVWRVVAVFLSRGVDLTFKRTRPVGEMQRCQHGDAGGVGVGRFAGDKGVHVLRLGRQAGEIEGEPANQRRPVGVGDGQNRHDASVVHGKREPFLGFDLGLDAHGPARTDQSVDWLHRQVKSRSRGRRASIAFRTRMNATAGDRPVVDFRLFFGHLGASSGERETDLQGSSALPEQTSTSSTIDPCCAGRAGGERDVFEHSRWP